MIGKASREPRRGAGGLGPCSRPAGVRTRWDWEGWVPLNEPEPDQASRAAPLVTGLALRRQPALEGDPAGFGALSACARSRVSYRDGRGHPEDAGRPAHVRAGDREAED